MITASFSRCSLSILACMLSGLMLFSGCTRPAYFSFSAPAEKTYQKVTPQSHAFAQPQSLAEKTKAKDTFTLTASTAPFAGVRQRPSLAKALPAPTLEEDLQKLATAPATEQKLLQEVETKPQADQTVKTKQDRLPVHKLAGLGLSLSFLGVVAAFFAIVALYSGIIWLVVLSFLAGLFGALIGNNALKQIRANPEKYAGARAAKTAIVVGILVVAAWLAAFGFLALF